MEFTADQVWGLAVRADITNGGYSKEDVWDYSQEPPILVKTANKKLVKQWLREGRQPNEEEIAQAADYRNHMATFTFKAIAKGLNEFEQQALNIAQMTEFSGRNLLEFAIISYLPELVRRDRTHTEFKRELYSSEQLAGAEGDTVIGDIEVFSSNYSPNYNKFKIRARMGESFVDFWYSEPLEGELRIKARIKKFRGDKTTALNYVKKA
jgi:hypothetical protein